MNRISTLIACISLLAACSNQPKKQEKPEEEDLRAKELLQGIWVDDMTETPLIRIKGDSIYYIDESVHPATFKIIGDSLKTYGQQTASYHIKKKGEYFFWIESAMGEILQLSKSENTVDSLLSQETIPSQKPDREVIQKDHIVHFNNIRYRGYVYINPTDIKVIQPEITEEGLEIENVYYDNIIHICVYEGKKSLFARDMKKGDFEPLIPAEYFRRSILTDMDFAGVDAKGYQYQATLCIPNSATCYLINISITKDGDISYELCQ